ncbi:MAG: aromatic amino acid lyase, partial [Candidatus Omnitrophica bacterium]|nr:aromatic amino acid lyase [Candidatus Omnitrophota bacterium]
ILLILGDAVHYEPTGKEGNAIQLQIKLSGMDDSVEIMQDIMGLKIENPDYVYFIDGNHDNPDAEIVKSEVEQSRLLREALVKRYGNAYLDVYREFFAKSPVLLLANGLVATHAAPIPVSRKRIFDLERFKRLEKSHKAICFVIWARHESFLKIVRGDMMINLLATGLIYRNDNISAFLEAVAQPDAHFVVGHSQDLIPEGRFYQRITRRLKHYVLYAGRDVTGYALFNNRTKSLEFVSVKENNASNREPHSQANSRLLVQEPQREMGLGKAKVEYDLNTGRAIIRGRTTAAQQPTAQAAVDFLQNNHVDLRCWLDSLGYADLKHRVEIEFTHETETLGQADSIMGSLKLHWSAVTRSPPLLAKITLLEEILHYFLPQKDPLVHNLVNEYIAGNLYEPFQQAMQEAAANGISPAKGWLERLSELNAEKQEALSRITKCLAAIRGRTYQEGNVVDLRNLPADKEIILIGDLHARVDNFNGILSHQRLEQGQLDKSVLEKVRSGEAILIILGDAPHYCPHDEQITYEELQRRLRDMKPSIEIMAQIMDLTIEHPDSVYYFIGNHDSPDAEFEKGGVNQAEVYRRELIRKFGSEYLELYRKFIAASPVLLLTNGLITTHAAPIKNAELEEIKRLPKSDPRIYFALWARLGIHGDERHIYTISDVEGFRNRLGQPNAFFVVSHSPHLLPEGKFYHIVARRHYILYAARDVFGYAVFKNGGKSIDFVEVSNAKTPQGAGAVLSCNPPQLWAGLLMGAVAYFFSGSGLLGLGLALGITSILMFVGKGLKFAGLLRTLFKLLLTHLSKTLNLIYNNKTAVFTILISILPLLLASSTGSSSSNDTVNPELRNTNIIWFYLIIILFSVAFSHCWMSDAEAGEFFEDVRLDVEIQEMERRRENYRNWLRANAERLARIRNDTQQRIRNIGEQLEAGFREHFPRLEAKRCKLINDLLTQLMQNSADAVMMQIIRGNDKTYVGSYNWEVTLSEDGMLSLFLIDNGFGFMEQTLRGFMSEVFIPWVNKDIINLARESVSAETFFGGNGEAMLRIRRAIFASGGKINVHIDSVNNAMEPGKSYEMLYEVPPGKRSVLEKADSSARSRTSVALQVKFDLGEQFPKPVVLVRGNWQEETHIFIKVEPEHRPEVAMEAEATIIQPRRLHELTLTMKLAKLAMQPPLQDLEIMVRSDAAPEDGWVNVLAPRRIAALNIGREGRLVLCLRPRKPGMEKLMSCAILTLKRFLESQDASDYIAQNINFRAQIEQLMNLPSKELAQLIEIPAQMKSVTTQDRVVTDEVPSLIATAETGYLHEDVHVQAIEELGRLADIRATPTLTKILNDTQSGPRRRMAAVQTLDKIADPQALVSLFTVIGEDSEDRTLRDAAILAVNTIGRTVDVGSFEERLSEFTGTFTWAIYPQLRAVLKRAIKIIASSTTVPVLREVLLWPDRLLRVCASRELAKIKDSRATNTLLELLRVRAKGCAPAPELAIDDLSETHALAGLREFGNEDTVMHLSRLWSELPAEQMQYIFDDHGAVVLYTQMSAAGGNIGLVEQRLVSNPLVSRVERTIKRINQRLEIKRKRMNIDINAIADKRLKDFQMWLRLPENKEFGEYIVVIGGGVRDAYAGNILGDIDISVAVPLTDEERISFVGPESQANQRICDFAMEKLRLLAERLGVGVDNFLPPVGTRKTMWGQMEIQYFGPVKLRDREGRPVYLKRILVDQESRAIYPSITGAALLHMAMDCQGNLYGRVDSLEDFEQGRVRLAGGGANLAIGDILRLFRCKHQFGKEIPEDDYRLVVATIQRYISGELPLPERIIRFVVERQIDKLLETAQDRKAALEELRDLGIYELLRKKCGPSWIEVEEALIAIGEPRYPKEDLFVRVAREKAIWATLSARNAELAPVVPDECICQLLTNHREVIIAARKALIELIAIQYELLQLLIETGEYTRDEARRVAADIMETPKLDLPARPIDSQQIAGKLKIVLLPEIKEIIRDLLVNELGANPKQVTAFLEKVNTPEALRDNFTGQVNLLDLPDSLSAQLRLKSIILLWERRIEEDLANRYVQAVDDLNQVERQKREAIYNDPAVTGIRKQVTDRELRALIRWIFPRLFKIPHPKDIERPDIVLVSRASTAEGPVIGKWLSKALGISTLFSTDIVISHTLSYVWDWLLAKIPGAEQLAQRVFPEIYNSAFSEGGLRQCYAHSLMTTVGLKGVLDRLIMKGTSAIIEGTLMPDSLPEEYFNRANIIRVVARFKNGGIKFQCCGTPAEIEAIRRIQEEIIRVAKETEAFVADVDADLEQSLQPCLDRIKGPDADRGLPIKNELRVEVEEDLNRRRQQLSLGIKKPQAEAQAAVCQARAEVGLRPATFPLRIIRPLSLEQIERERALYAAESQKQARIAQALTNECILTLFLNHEQALAATRNALISVREFQDELLIRLAALKQHDRDDARVQVRELLATTAHLNNEQRERLSRDVKELLFPELKRTVKHLLTDEFNIKAARIDRVLDNINSLPRLRQEVTELVYTLSGQDQTVAERRLTGRIDRWEKGLDGELAAYFYALRRWRATTQAAIEAFWNDPAVSGDTRLNFRKKDLYEFIHWVFPCLYGAPRLKNINRPTIIMVAGASGSGRETISQHLAEKLSISTYISTDVSVEVVKSSISWLFGEEETRQMFPELFRSVYDGPDLHWYYTYSSLAMLGVTSMIEQLIRLDTSAICSGVALPPGILSERYFRGVDCIWFTVSIDDADVHLERFTRKLEVYGKREAQAEDIQRFRRTIRPIHNWIVQRAKRTDVDIVDNTSQLTRTLELAEERLRQVYVERGLPVEDEWRDRAIADLDSRRSQLVVSSNETPNGHSGTDASPKRGLNGRFTERQVRKIREGALSEGRVTVNTRPLLVNRLLQGHQMRLAKIFAQRYPERAPPPTSIDRIEVIKVDEKEDFEAVILDIDERRTLLLTKQAAGKFSNKDLTHEVFEYCLRDQFDAHLRATELAQDFIDEISRPLARKAIQEFIKIEGRDENQDLVLPDEYKPFQQNLMPQEREKLEQALSLIAEFTPDILADVSHPIYIYKADTSQLNCNFCDGLIIGKEIKFWVMISPSAFGRLSFIIDMLGYYLAGGYPYFKNHESELLLGEVPDFQKSELTRAKGSTMFLRRLIHNPDFRRVLPADELALMETQMLGEKESKMYGLAAFESDQVHLKQIDFGETRPGLGDAAVMFDEVDREFGLYKARDERFYRLRREIVQAITDAPAGEPAVVLGAGRLNDIPDELFSSDKFSKIYLVDINAAVMKEAIAARGLEGQLESGKICLVEADISMVNPCFIEVMTQAINGTSTPDEVQAAIAQFYAFTGLGVAISFQIPQELQGVKAGLVISTLIYDDLFDYYQHLINMRVCQRFGEPFKFRGDLLCHSEIPDIDASTQFVLAVRRAHIQLLRELVAEDGIVYFSGFLAEFQPFQIRLSGYTPEQLEVGMNKLAESVLQYPDLIPIPQVVFEFWEEFYTQLESAKVQWSNNEIVFNAEGLEQDNPWLENFNVARTGVWYWENLPGLGIAQLIQSMVLKPKTESTDNASLPVDNAAGTIFSEDFLKRRRAMTVTSLNCINPFGFILAIPVVLLLAIACLAKKVYIHIKAALVILALFLVLCGLPKYMPANAQETMPNTAIVKTHSQPKPAAKPTFEALQQVISNDKDLNLRLKAIRELTAFKDEPGVFQLLSGLASDEGENISVRSEAICVMAMFDKEEAKIAKILTTILDKERKGSLLRYTAISNLIKFKNPEVRNYLIKIVKTPKNHSERKEAVKALGGYKEDQEIFELLVSVVSDPYEDPLVSVEAIKVAGGFRNPRLVEPLLKALESNFASVRRCAIIELGKLGAYEAVPALKKALQDVNPGVRDDAINSLRIIINSSDDVQLILECIKIPEIRSDAMQRLREVSYEDWDRIKKAEAKQIFFIFLISFAPIFLFLLVYILMEIEFKKREREVKQTSRPQQVPVRLLSQSIPAAGGSKPAQSVDQETEALCAQVFASIPEITKLDAGRSEALKQWVGEWNRRFKQIKWLNRGDFIASLRVFINKIAIPIISTAQEPSQLSASKFLDKTDIVSLPMRQRRTAEEEIVGTYQLVDYTQAIAAVDDFIKTRGKLTAANTQLSGPRGTHPWRVLWQFLAGAVVSLWNSRRAKQNFFRPAIISYRINLEYIRRAHGTRAPPWLTYIYTCVSALFYPTCERRAGKTRWNIPQEQFLRIGKQLNIPEPYLNHTLGIILLHESERTEILGLAAQYNIRQAFPGSKLIALSKRIADFRSKTPDYFLFILERALYLTRISCLREPKFVTILDCLDSAVELGPLVVECIERRKTKRDPYSLLDLIPASRQAALRNCPRDTVLSFINILTDNYLSERRKFVPDIVFRPESGLVFCHAGKRYVFLGNFASQHGRGIRIAEIEYNRRWFISQGYEIIEAPAGISFEGGAEVKYVKHGNSVTIICGWGFRTEKPAIGWLEWELRKIVGDGEFNRKIEIISAHAIREEAYHLDTALREIPVVNEAEEIIDETIMYYPGAFDTETQGVLRKRFPNALEVSEEDFLNFACNSPAIGKIMIMDERVKQPLKDELNRRGIEVREINLSEFVKAGGGGKCLICELDSDPYSLAFDHNNKLQLLASPRGVLDVQYINDGFMVGKIGAINKGLADKQHRMLVRALYAAGAEIVFMDTEEFRSGYDFRALWDSIYSILKDDSLPRRARKRLGRLLKSAGGYVGIGQILSRSDLSEGISLVLSETGISKCGGLMALRSLIYEIRSRYLDFYDSEPQYPQYPYCGLRIALYEELGLSDKNLAEQPVVFNGQKISHPEDIIPQLVIIDAASEHASHPWRVLWQFLVGALVSLWNSRRAKQNFFRPAIISYRINLEYLRQTHGTRAPPWLTYIYACISALFYPTCERRAGKTRWNIPQEQFLRIGKQLNIPEPYLNHTLGIILLHESERTEFLGLVAQYRQSDFEGFTVVALGGNALPGAFVRQEAAFAKTLPAIESMIASGYRLIFTHGNGPQVGDSVAEDTQNAMPMFVHDARTQGSLGLVVAQGLNKALKGLLMSEEALACLTRVVVAKDDPSFKKPGTKQIGKWYTKPEAETESKKHPEWEIKKIREETEDNKKVYRRVVPSPQPIDIVEIEYIRRLVRNGVLLVTCGGGGIPVIRFGNGLLRGVDCVIDKDRTSALLAVLLGAKKLIILTNVKEVSLNYGKPNEEPLRKATISQVRRLLEEGHFGTGDMAPKIQAAIYAIENGIKQVIITDAGHLLDALQGKEGTMIVADKKPGTLKEKLGNSLKNPLILQLLILAVFFIFLPFEHFFKAFPLFLIASAIKFASLGTFGELRGARIRLGEWRINLKEVKCKFCFTWPVLGVIIKLAFEAFKWLIPILLGLLAIDGSRVIGTIPVTGIQVTVRAVAISILMNISFGYVLMALHRFLDNYFGNREWLLRFSKLTRKDLNGVIPGEDETLLHYLFKNPYRTLYWFWIPWHIITFSLTAGAAQITWAAIGGVVLGIILGLTAKGKGGPKVQAGMIPLITLLLTKIHIPLKHQAWIEQGVFWGGNLWLWVALFSNNLLHIVLAGLLATAIIWSIFFALHFLRTNSMPHAPPGWWRGVLFITLLNAITIGVILTLASIITIPYLSYALVLAGAVFTTAIHHYLNIKYITYLYRSSLAAGTKSSLDHAIINNQERFAQLLDTAEISAALSREAMRAHSSPFNELIQMTRPHPAQIESACLGRILVNGSTFIDLRRGQPQDAYSLRGIPQIHGAVRRMLNCSREALDRERRSMDQGYGINQVAVNIAQDQLAIAAVALAGIAERRIFRLVDPELSNGLPEYLTPDPGANSGMMIPQYTAAGQVAKMRNLAESLSHKGAQIN